MENTETTYFCNLLRSKIPAWKDLKNDEIDYHLFSSITNKVYGAKVKREDISPKCVILRRFCGEEGIIDKAKELVVFQRMSEIGIGPKCYGHEGDVRLEEYIPSRNIEAHEYKQKIMRRKLAKSLAELHNVDVPNINKTPLFEGILKNHAYFEQFDKKCEQDIYSEKEKEMIEKLKSSTSLNEREFIKSILPSDSIVFSHNDLLSGNVLIAGSQEEVRFIDYEYASYNFRGFDIGNMYREAIFDYTEPNAPYFRIVESNHPNEEELREFLRYYIAFVDMSEEKQKEKAEELINNDEAMKSYLETKYKSEELQAREDVLYRETKIGAMLSFYYWMIWAVKMFKSNDIQFGYLEFAVANYEHYEKLKSYITKLADSEADVKTVPDGTKVNNRGL